MRIRRSRFPNGWLIGRKILPPFWEFWNPGHVWAGSGYLFRTRRQAREKLLQLKACAKP